MNFVMIVIAQARNYVIHNCLHLASLENTCEAGPSVRQIQCLQGEFMLR